MARSVQEMMAEANASVARIDMAQAQALIAQGALLLDVRDGAELMQTGRAVGAHHVPRGMLEFRADPASPAHDPALAQDRPVILYCASGGRSALSGKLLQDMGFAQVYNLGGLSDWQNADGAVETI